jgi:hypothetical protein
MSVYPHVGRKPESKGNMPIIEIESAWRETGIVCPFCEGEWMTYSNGETRPQCGNDNCLRTMPDEYIYEWLITLPEFRQTLRAADGACTCGSIKKLILREDGVMVCGFCFQPRR